MSSGRYWGGFGDHQEQQYTSSGPMLIKYATVGVKCLILTTIKQTLAIFLFPCKYFINLLTKVELSVAACFSFAAEPLEKSL